MQCPTDSKMKITIEPTQDQEPFEVKHRKVSVAIDDDDIDIHDFIEDLLKPALLAVGYGKKIVQQITAEK